MSKLKISTILFSFVLILNLTSACEWRSTEQIIGVDPIKEVLLLEDHSEVLLQWLKKEYEGKIVVNIDRHDDLRQIREQKIEKLKELYEKKKWEEIASNRDRGAEGLFTVGDFLYPAYRLGIIRKLYWASYSPLLIGRDLEAGGRKMLKELNYPDDLVDSFIREGKSLRGNMYGLDVIISNLQNLPKIEEPVILTVDIDVFEDAIQFMNYSGLMLLRDFLKKLKAMHLPVEHVSIAYSNRGNFTAITQRHLGDELKQIFTDPEIIKQGFPEMWITRDRAFSLIRQGRHSQAVSEFAVAQAIYPDEPSFKLGSAISLAMIGKNEKSLNSLEELVHLKPEYDYAYISIAKMLGHNNLKAHDYYREYLKRHPDSFHGLMAYGSFFYNRGKYEEALALYQRSLVQFIHVNTVIGCGDALMKLGKYSDAKMYYMKGLELLPTIGYRSIQQYPQLVRFMKYLSRENRWNMP